MTIPKGWDPSSLGLVRKGDNPNDERFTPVEFDGRIVWALHPKHFNEATLDELFEPYRQNGKNVITNSEIFVQNVDVKNILTNNNSSSVNRFYMPVYAGQNFMGGYDSPAEYANLLENAYIDLELLEEMGFMDDGLVENIADVAMDELADILRTIGGVQWDENGEAIGEIRGVEPWRLNYSSSLFKSDELHTEIELDIRDLPGIDLNSSDSVSISFADGNSVSYPLPNIMSGEDEDNHILRVRIIATHMHGFWYLAEFAGRTIQGRYSQEIAHKAIVSDYSEHMLKNAYREIIIHISRLYHTAKDVLSNFNFNTREVSTETPDETTTTFTQDRMIDAAGGINAILTGVEDYATREAMFADMQNSTRNMGGTVLVDAIDQIVDMFVEIDYPIADKLNTADGKVITPSDFAVNDAHTYNLNSRFAGVDHLMNHINNNFPGETIKIDSELVFEYGRYNDYFTKLVNKGALMDDSQ